VQFEGPDLLGEEISSAQAVAVLALSSGRARPSVDTSYRHIESYVAIESRRRAGPNVASALALHNAAFPDGLAHIDAPIPDENRVCRESLTVLRSAEYTPTIAAVGLPAAWMAKMRATAAARATLRENEKKPAAPVAPANDQPS
jgi:hypothetical protein